VTPAIGERINGGFISMSRILNGTTYQTFFRFLTTKINPIKKIKNDITKNTAPAMIGIAASSQLTRPSVAIGNAADIPVPARPSKTPKIPKTKTIFQSIDSPLTITGWTKPTAIALSPEKDGNQSKTELFLHIRPAAFRQKLNLTPMGLFFEN
jgi:hypothetical protein